MIDRMRYLLCSLSIFIVACQENHFYDQEIQIDTSQWAYDSPMAFDINVEDTSMVYEMQMILSHSTEYPYENLYLKIRTEFPSIEAREENLNIQLADKKGQWIGKCNASNCKTKVYLLENFKFPEIGNYGFSFEQHTRDSVLNSISGIRLILKTSDK